MALFVLGSLVAACGPAGGGPSLPVVTPIDAPIDALPGGNPLAGTTWSLQSIGGTAPPAGVSVTLELTGSALMSTEADAKTAKRGFDAALHGRLKYDHEKKAVTELTILAVGDHWGRSAFTPGDRPGRKPLGMVFELVSGKAPAERVPPQASREFDAYFAAK